MAHGEAYMGKSVDNREIEMPCHLGLERSPRQSGLYLEVVPVREFHSGLIKHKGEKKSSYYLPVVVNERKDSARLPIHARRYFQTLFLATVTDESRGEYIWTRH